MAVKSKSIKPAGPKTRRRPERTKRVLNCDPSPKQEDDWQVGNAEDAGVLAAARIPKSKDLREDWWAIGDQGSTGSCVGWASADSVLRWHYVKAGLLDSSDRLSVRFQWMAAKETDEFQSRPTTFIEAEGTSLKSALDVARKYGAVRDSDLPFATGELFSGNAKTFYLRASRLKINAYINLGRKLEDWRRWLATTGPILTRLDCDDNWFNPPATGNLDRYDAASATGGHAVALVGYTTTRFVVRNSWGTAWADDGFAYASNRYASSAFTEAFGVTL